MEWIGHLLLGFLVLGGLVQLFWAYALSAIAKKTDQGEFMQVLAWIPILQIAPTLAAGGSSVGRFLLGTLALCMGNAVLIGVSILLGGDFGNTIAGLGLGLTGLLCLFYFGRIACNTAIARDLPGWMGLLLFVPILNVFIYPYFAFHDGWIRPNPIGLAIGTVLVLGGTAPTFQAVRVMNENGGFSPELILAMSKPEFAAVDAIGDQPAEAFILDSSGPEIAESPVIEPKVAQRQDESIRALYQLKGRFDTLDSLATPENFLIHDHRVRALGIIQSIRADLESQREKLDGSTFAELATHLLEVEARAHAPSSRAAARAGTRASTRPHQIGPAAPAPTGRATATPSFNDATLPPVRPFPVQASDECPKGTEMRTKKDDQNEEEWCQQLPALGGLRHGLYARYHIDGRPESMGQYQDGLRVGIWTRFYPTGEIRAQAQFREGLQHGWVLTFDESGERTRSARFERGARVQAQ